MRLKHKVSIITSAAQGIGAVIEVSGGMTA